MHIGAKWRELAQRRGDHVAIVDDHGRWSYRDLHARIARLGNALAGLGLRKVDRVALLVPDIREYLEADYAIMSAGFGAGAARSPLDRHGIDGVAALRGRGGIDHARLVRTDGGRAHRRDREVPRHIVWIGGNDFGDGPRHDYEALLRRASEQPLGEGDGDDLSQPSISPAARPVRPKPRCCSTET